MRNLMQTHKLLFVPCLILMSVLAACVPTALTTPTSSEAEVPTATSPAAAHASAFPVTIEHKFGSVTIPAEPQRVITLGFSEQDAVLALGVTPVAIREWFGEQPHAVWPWSQPALGDAKPEVINMAFGELNFEALAALQPDLFVATHSGITAEEYAILAQIAPTLAQPGEYDDFGVPWQEQTRLIGLALGRSQQAESLIRATETQIAAAANPTFATATVAWITPADAPGEFWVTGPNTPPMRFLAALGFQYPAEVAELIGANSSLLISSERLDLIDTTVLILRAPTQEALDAILAEPIVQQLSAIQEERAIFFVGADPVYGALSFSTVTSLPYVVEQLVPKLAAITGNAAATRLTCEAGFHAFAHEQITTPVCIPNAPQRVVTLEPFYALQMSLELGLPVIGSTAFTGEGDFPTALTPEETAGIVPLGAFDAPNLEAITALKPDLIIGDAYFQQEQYALLSAIAPTVLINTPDWKAWFTTVAAAGGVSERAEQAFAEYDARVAAISAQLPSVTVSFVRVAPGGFQLYREAPNAYAPIAIMTEVGIARPDFEVGSDENSWERLDWEGLINLTGDVLFYVVGGADDDEDGSALEAEVTSNPIWQQLPAVQAGRAYRVNAEHWMSFGGLRSAHAVLDDIESLLMQ
jgi:iron complex transport system substrate-binding protein